MRLRWRWFFPGFPASLLALAVLAAWAILCWTPRGYLADSAIQLYPRGFPIMYTAHVRELDARWSEACPLPCLVNLALALAAAWTLAMAVDRLVFPAIRAARRRNRGTGAAG